MDNAFTFFSFSTFCDYLPLSSQDVFGTSLDHDLIEGGDSVAVNKENRQQFVDLYAGMWDTGIAIRGSDLADHDSWDYQCASSSFPSIMPFNQFDV